MSTATAFLSHNSQRYHHERDDALRTAPAPSFPTTTAPRSHNKPRAASSLLHRSFPSQHLQQPQLTPARGPRREPSHQPLPSQAIPSHCLALLQAQRLLTLLLQQQQQQLSSRRGRPHAKALTMHGAVHNPTSMDFAPWLLDGYDQQQSFDFAAPHQQQAWQDTPRKPSFGNTDALTNSLLHGLLGAATNNDSGNSYTGSNLSAPSSSNDGAAFASNWEATAHDGPPQQQHGLFTQQQSSHSAASSPSSADSLETSHALANGWSDLLASNQSQEALLSSILGGLGGPHVPGVAQEATQRATAQHRSRDEAPMPTQQPREHQQQRPEAPHACQPGRSAAHAPAASLPSATRQPTSAPHLASNGNGGSPFSDGSDALSSHMPPISSLAPSAPLADNPRNPATSMAPEGDMLDLPDLGPDGLFLGDDSAFDLDVLACLDYGNDTLPQRSATEALDAIEASLNDSASTDDAFSVKPGPENAPGRNGHSVLSNPRLKKVGQAPRKRRRRRRRLTETKKRELRNEQLRLLNIRNAQLKLTLHNLRREANQFEDVVYSVFLKYGRVPGAKAQSQ